MIIKLLKRFWEFIKSIWHKLTGRKKDAVEAATPVDAAAAQDEEEKLQRMTELLNKVIKKMARDCNDAAKNESLINFKTESKNTYQNMLDWGMKGFKRHVGFQTDHDLFTGSFTPKVASEIAANFKIAYKRMQPKKPKSAAKGH